MLVGKRTPGGDANGANSMKWFYNLLYGRFRAPWDIGPRKELVELVTSGRLKPGR
jgi:hypothetical protein